VAEEPGWLKKDIILFATDPDKHLDHTYKLNFTDSRAKIDSGSPGNKAEEIIVTKLMFFGSGIFWVNGIELEKKK
jgi:hypothetical protein